jgi:hypothetical protein
MKEIWPIPKQIDNIGIFENINSFKTFNEIIGDPQNYNTIKNNKELYSSWILPSAIILFGKKWFNKIKFKNHIKGAPFMLSSNDNKDQVLEETIEGRAIIEQIKNKIDSSLNKYLETAVHRNPGGYIVESLKNEFIRERGKELGFNLKSTLICPYCFSKGLKTVLIHHGSNNYSCPNCEILVKNLEYLKTEEALKQLESVRQFINFNGTTCICPSNNCKGFFIPLNFKLDIVVLKNTVNFIEPPDNIKDTLLTCPYCYTKFSIKEALSYKSGFKNKSGFLTGLPSASIWKKYYTTMLDQNRASDDASNTFKNDLADNFIDIDNNILNKQKASILINELIINLSKINISSVSKLQTFYFYIAIIKWITKHYNDAIKYFFDIKETLRPATYKEILLHGTKERKFTNVPRGQEIGIHQAIFNIWMDTLDENIKEFTILDKSIKSLSDFKWWCFQPKFSGGPKAVFQSTVNNKIHIKNNTDIKDLSSNFNPRLGKILSIFKLNSNINYVDKIKFYEWQNIILDPKCGLKKGDDVIVEALVMSGHPTHAPIQRIIRLRTTILKPIIEIIKQEEHLGTRNKEFWNDWENRVKQSQTILKRRINGRK